MGDLDMATRSSDRPGLERFIVAQADVYANALGEIRLGRKTTHWMWFIFPQLQELGRSEMAHFYGISSLDEARSYWRHPILGSRLRECIQGLLEHRDKSAVAVLGNTDAMKLHSCLTLFSAAAADPADQKLTASALEQFYEGVLDKLTVEILATQRH
jgi:uncharacterized protein (DUF1810 family)